ncbi:uncharacterized protein ACR2FA_006879 [Aphomia sociella]
MSIRPLSPELAEKARVELNEDPKRLKEDLQHVRDWLAKQPHIRARTDDQWLTVFLRGCKYSLERLKVKMDLYYTIHTAAPELFGIKHTDALFDEIYNLGPLVVLPKPPGPDSPLIIIFRPGQYDPNKYSMADVMSVSNIVQKVVLVDNDNASVAGFRCIMDLEGATMTHFLKMSPTEMKKGSVLSQDAMPIRMKGFHYLNTPPGFETVFNFVKGLLNEKNRSRLYVHNKNYDELYKTIPKECLPTEYGGKGGTIKEILDHWRAKVQEYDSWLKEDEKYGVDESKRPGKPKTSEDLFGVEGSFRQLEFLSTQLLLLLFKHIYWASAAPQVPRNHNHLQCNEQDVSSAIFSFKNGSAAGLDEFLHNVTDLHRHFVKKNVREYLQTYIFKMSVRPLSPELAEKARVELNEDPKRLKEDLQHIKDWLAKQPHIRARTDDQWLTLFLRGCKFSLERVKQKLDLYYTIRTAVPEFFRLKHTDTLFNEIFNMGIMIILPKPPGPASPLVGIFRPGLYDPNKYDMMDIIAVSNAIQKIVIVDNDNGAVAGFQSIMDLEGATMAHFLQMSPHKIKKMTVFSQDAAPVRMKGFHYLNTPTGFETIFNTMKGFLNEKNRNRLHVHNKNYEELYKFIPKDVLPAEYGGNGGTIAEILDYWRKKIQDYSSWLEEDEKFGVDESKRPGKPKTAEDLFGIEGSFRQLEFD